MISQITITITLLGLSNLEPHCRRFFYAFKRDLVAYQGSDIVYPVPDADHLIIFRKKNKQNSSPNHSWSLQTQTPSMNPHIFRKTHRLQHFRPEHATIPDLDPFIEHRMERENLERGLSAS